MSLFHTLEAIREFADLRHLVGSIGFPAAWEEFDPRVLAAGRRAGTRITAAAVAGRGHGIEWIAVLVDEPLAEARRLARWFASHGRLVGVVAFSRETRLLAIGIAAGDAPAVAFNLAIPGVHAVQRLERLAPSGEESGLALALHLAAILSGEDAGQRFFHAFRQLLTGFAESLTGQLRADQRHNLALLQLTRVLFLYFVQCKGWLDGRPDFLRQAVDQCLARRRRLHRDLFQPLFFGTLNRRPELRGRARAFGRIPFLNGGLFEPHPLERSWRGDVPNAMWRDVFDQLFERFGFTVSEAGAEGEVAPDMLGRVFEGVMDPTARHGSGTFYTPVHLVRQLVDASLEAYLAGRLGCGLTEARRHLEASTAQARSAMLDVTVLDPAVGSGAFLLGMLDRLAGIRAGGAPTSQARREVLSRNLFGVDVNPMAVRLTELRLWLAVIADDPAETPEQVAPLPNLDGLIRQGDSLLDPARLLGGLPLRAGIAGGMLADLRQRFVVAVGDDKRELARRLRHTELRAMLEYLDAATRRIETDIAECIAEGRAPDLFHMRRGLDSEMRRRLREARHRRAEIRRLRRRVTDEGQVPWFQFESHFADVMARGGFEIVLGNPPWVRAEELAPGLRERLTDRYRWWKGQGPGFRHQPDLAVAFVERGFELLSEGGVLTLLLPAKLATAQYGAPARRGLVAEATLHRIADLGQAGQDHFDATVYPLALVATKRPPDGEHLIRIGLNGCEGHPVSQRRLMGGGPWVLLSPPVHEALDIMRAGHLSLGDQCSIQLGAKTGANEIFCEPPQSVEPALIRWAIRGRDVRAFHTERRVRLLWPHDQKGVVFPRLPARAAAYLAQHEGSLRARADYLSGPPWTLFRTRAASAPFRVVWADIRRRLTAAPLLHPADRSCIPLNTCYVIALPEAEQALALAAWLNSTWVRAAARVVADPARGGFARFNARVVGALPLPAGVLTDAVLAQLARLGSEGVPVQKEIDVRCAEHFRLPASAQAALATVAGVGADDRR